MRPIFAGGPHTLEGITISSELMFKFGNNNKRDVEYGGMEARYILKIPDLEQSKDDSKIIDRHLVLT